MPKTHTIILTAGKIDYTQLPFGMHQSNATIPVNGKPVISWVLDDLIQKSIKQHITVVIRDDNPRLKELLTQHYHNRIELNLVEVTQPISILHSLQSGLSTIDVTNDRIQLILGDTLLLDSFDSLSDCLLAAPVYNSENWCIVKTNDQNKLIGLIDKQQLPGNQFLALCGFYAFANGNLLSECVEQSIQAKEKELSKVLMRYHTKQPLSIQLAAQWFDFGHLESFIESKKSLLRPRHFNALRIDPLLNTITKISEHTNKLQDELDWYEQLPEKLKVLTPRILQKSEQLNQVHITQEFYGYPTLSELFVYGDLSVSVWESIINYTFKIHTLFKEHEASAQPESLIEMYQLKTANRINELLAQDPFWKQLWDYPTVQINEKQCHNISAHLSRLKPKIDALTQCKSFHIIHGDYCLSNILYDLNNQIIRLIDPRGSFGAKGIYGDTRYDIAKLRHSICGGYDYVIADLFSIQYDANKIDYTMLNDAKNNFLAAYFDSMLVEQGYQPEEIQLIEALLFVSMLPLHKDYKDRQLMMYTRAIELFEQL